MSKVLMTLDRVFVGYEGYDDHIEDLSLTIGSEEIIGLCGDSGSGKSSLAYVLCGLMKPTSGHIQGDFQRVQMVMQNPETALDGRKTIAYSLREAYYANHQQNPTKEILEDSMTYIGMSPDRLKDSPRFFSGGELQRISITRALLCKPQFLILDEATSMLDLIVQARMMKLLRRVKEERRLSLMVISHDIYLIKHFCDRAFRLENKTLLPIT